MLPNAGMIATSFLHWEAHIVRDLGVFLSHEGACQLPLQALLVPTALNQNNTANFIL